MMNHSPVTQPFGQTPEGQPVQLITLSTPQISCEILTYGGILRRLLVPDAQGQWVDVVLGMEKLEDYQQQTIYLGSLVGRCANRIQGGQFTLDDQTYTLDVNNGPNHLHGGLEGFHQRVWTVESLSPSHVALSLTSPAGDQGYPGALQVRVTYTLEDAGLTIHYQGETTAPTLCNLTNHSYFNLSGHKGGSILNHKLRLLAQHYTPTDPYGIPTGEIASVENTPMDFRSLRTLVEREQLDPRDPPGAQGYDHNFVLDGPSGVLRPVAWAISPVTGILLQVHTTLPGLQVYTANFVEPNTLGKDSAVYGPHHGLCLESQYFPDAIHHPHFPSPILRPGSAYDHTTRFAFSLPFGEDLSRLL